MIVLSLPLWPLFRPVAWLAGFYPLIRPEGRGVATGALTSRRGVLRHAVVRNAGVAVFISTLWP
jgi:hypothetical protein